MSSPGLHRFATLLAFFTFGLVIAGGLVTSNDAGLSVPDWPLSYGKLMPAMEGGILYEHSHRMIAATAGLLTIALAIWIWRAGTPAALRRLALGAAGMVVAQGLLGGAAVLFLLPRPISIAHAVLAELFFTCTVVMAVLTAARPAEMVEDRGYPPLRALAVLAPAAVLMQTILGAAVRHRALDVIPHIAGALFTVTVVGWTALWVRMTYHGHAQLRRAALAALCITLLQAALGVAAYVSRVITADAPQPLPVMVWFTVAHVAAGALTMAGSVVLGLQVFRNVRPAGALAAEGATVTS